MNAAQRFVSESHDHGPFASRHSAKLINSETMALICRGSIRAVQSDGSAVSSHVEMNAGAGG